MRYIYRIGNQEYIVGLVGNSSSTARLETNILVEIEFICRINGGRGRMPRTKRVLSEKLEPLVDFEIARKSIKG